MKCTIKNIGKKYEGTSMETLTAAVESNSTTIGGGDAVVTIELMECINGLSVCTNTSSSQSSSATFTNNSTSKTVEESWSKSNQPSIYIGAGPNNRLLADGNPITYAELTGQNSYGLSAEIVRSDNYTYTTTIGTTTYSNCKKYAYHIYADGSQYWSKYIGGYADYVSHSFMWLQ